MQNDDVVIIDYGLGNLRSVKNRFSQFSNNVIITQNIDLIKSAKRLVLPGVGSYRKGMRNLRDLGLIEVLNETVINKGTPILGICLGMQLFAKSGDEGDEGDCEGLGWIDARVKKFDVKPGSKFRVPHYGWNTIQKERESTLLKDIKSTSEFYFVHSYHMLCEDKSDVLTTSNYGHVFASAVLKNNIFGVQFHPEKSYRDGDRLINNFLDYV